MLPLSPEQRLRAFLILCNLCVIFYAILNLAYVSVDPLGKNLFIFGKKSKNIARQTRPFLSSVSEILVDDYVFKIVLFGIKKMRLDPFSLQAKAIWQRIYSCQLVWGFFVPSVVCYCSVIPNYS